LNRQPVRKFQCTLSSLKAHSVLSVTADKPTSVQTWNKMLPNNELSSSHFLGLFTAISVDKQLKDQSGLI